MYIWQCFAGAAKGTAYCMPQDGGKLYVTKGNCKCAPHMYPSAKAGQGEQEDGGRNLDPLYKPAAPNARQSKAELGAQGAPKQG